jgi:hypothetical protein
VQDHLDADSGAGKRTLYVTEIALDERVLDLREASIALDFTPQEIEGRIPALAASGILWVLWFELPCEGRRWPQAIHIGVDPVSATPAGG